jgi:hypothetical protein
MKFCQTHWDALRTGIESRGLGHLIAANGREATLRVKAELEGSADMSDYDPLMAAHWMIVAEAQKYVGVALYFGEAICPVCELLTIYPPIPDGHRYTSNESYFIDGPADAVLQYCREHGIAEATRPDLPA